MLAFEARERRGRGSEYSTLPLPVRRVEMLADFQAVSTNSTKIRPMDQHTRQCYERRIRMILPVAQLFLVKRFIVLRTRVSQSVMIRMIRLNQDPSRTIATSRSSRNLRDQLKSPF